MSLFNLFKKEKNMNQSNCISQESDTPIPFGMKISWLVVKEKDPNTVMKKLNCTDIEVSNWQSAFSHMQKMKKVLFLSHRKRWRELPPRLSLLLYVKVMQSVPFLC